jgi:hypothetical protein
MAGKLVLPIESRGDFNYNKASYLWSKIAPWENSALKRTIGAMGPVKQERNAFLSYISGLPYEKRKEIVEALPDIPGRITKTSYKKWPVTQKNNNHTIIEMNKSKYEVLSNNTSTALADLKSSLRFKNQFNTDSVSPVSYTHLTLPTSP